jgi:hypothetical protein
MAEPFVPVPVRPARPRRRDEAAPRETDPRGSDLHEDVRAGDTDEVETGAPTDDLADAVQTAVNPVVTVVVPAPAAAPVLTGGLAVAARLAAADLARPGVPAPREGSRPVPDPGEPTTRLPRDPDRPARFGASATRNRHAVRAVLSAELAATALEEESDRIVAERAAGNAPLRDGRVRGRRGNTHETGTTAGARGGAAPDGAVPVPRQAPLHARDERPAPENGRPVPSADALRPAPVRSDRTPASGTVRPASALTFGGGRPQATPAGRRPESRPDPGNHATGQAPGRHAASEALR